RAVPGGDPEAGGAAHAGRPRPGGTGGHGHHRGPGPGAAARLHLRPGADRLEAADLGEPALPPGDRRSSPAQALSARSVPDGRRAGRPRPGADRDHHETALMATATVKLTIDGKPVEVPVGTTIFDAARTLKIPIPTLCHQQNETPVAVCRVCVVEVK